MFYASLILPMLLGAKLTPPSPRPVAASIRRFDQNAGQWPDDVRFVARTPRGLLVLGAADARLRLRGADGRSTAIGLRWDTGARTIDGVERLPGVSNYLLGSDRERWRRDVAGFRRVRYTEVAPRIDLEFYGAADDFEYDLVIRPGGDPAALTLGLDGVSRAHVDDDGSMLLETGAGTFRQHRPVAFQERGGVRTPVDARYELRDGRIGFRTSPYDRSRALVIDPTIDFSTYLGGNGADTAAAVATDAAGNIYVTGTTASADFPTASPLSMPAGGRDAFVVKLTPDGSALVYATYLGGTADDDARGIAVSAAGSAYVAGITGSSDFPSVNPVHAWSGGNDAFVARLSADGGSLVFSTHLGGSGDDDAHGIAVDGSGAAYVTGPTRSNSFPLLNAFRTAPGGSFIAKLSAAGALVYSTYFGNANDTTLPARRVNLHAIAVDGSGAAYVGGDSRGASIDATPGAFLTTTGTSHCEQGFRPPLPFIPCTDGVVAKLTASGLLAYSTYLRAIDEGQSGGAEDVVSGITVDAGGNAYVVGTTRSGGFPTTTGATVSKCPCSAGRVFVTALNATGSGLVSSAILGGTNGQSSGAGNDMTTGLWSEAGGPAPGIAIDRLGQTIVTGWTRANDLAAVYAQQPRIGSSGLFRLAGATPSVSLVNGPPGQVTQFSGSTDGTLFAIAGLLLFRSRDHGTTWTELAAPMAFFSSDKHFSLDPNNAATIYTTAGKSTDGGDTWVPLGKTFNDDAPQVRPGSPNVLFGVAGSGPVFKSVDGGMSWTKSSDGIPLGAFGRISISPADPNFMYFTDVTGTYGSVDGGTTWTTRPAPDVGGGLAPSPTQPLTVCRTGNTGIWKSVDGGFSWTRTLNASTSGLIAVSSTLLFASQSDSTVYISTDGGDSWTTVPDARAFGFGLDASAPETAFAIAQPIADGFVAALSPTGALLYESYLGGVGVDIAYGLATTPDGGFVVVGSTTSKDFPTANAFQPANAGSGDAFVTKLRFPQVLMGIGTPVDHATAFMPFKIGGWALDRGSATDPGVDGVHVWAFSSTGAPTFIAAVTPSVSRPDVAALFGPQFLSSGFNVMVAGLVPGPYTLAIYPHSRVTNTFATPQILILTVAEGGLIAIGVPTNGATAYGGTKLGGWAIDRASTTDTGVNAVHVYAYPNPGSGDAPIFLGVADYGVARPDVGGIFGSQFTNSGFNLFLPPLAPGPYLLVAFPFSAVTNAFLAPATVTVTIGPSRPNGVLNPPANNATISGSFQVGGWALDQSAPSGPGVDAVHVYAFPTSGAAGTFLGVATYGISRPDVGAIFGSEFTPSGYSLNAPALPPGTYDIYAFSRSTVSGTFNFASVARITVQ